MQMGEFEADYPLEDTFSLVQTKKAEDPSQPSDAPSPPPPQPTASQRQLEWMTVEANFGTGLTTTESWTCSKRSCRTSWSRRSNSPMNMPPNWPTTPASTSTSSVNYALPGELCLPKLRNRQLRPTSSSMSTTHSSRLRLP